MGIDATAGQAEVWRRARQNLVCHVVEETGVLEIFLPGNDVVISIARGHLSEAMARAWQEATDPHFDRGLRADTFIDWEHLTGYASEARKRLTSWVLSRHRNIPTARFLVASRLVAMGVSTASVAASLVGIKMTATSSRSEFDADLARRL